MTNVKLALLIAFSIFVGYNYRYESVDYRVVNEYHKYKNILMRNCRSKFTVPLSVDVKVEKIEEVGVIGICIDTGSNPHITLSEQYINIHKNDKKTSALVAHELTHCFLHQNHLNIPGHYMHESDQPVESVEALDEQIKEYLTALCQ